MEGTEVRFEFLLDLHRIYAMKRSEVTKSLKQYSIISSRPVVTCTCVIAELYLYI